MSTDRELPASHGLPISRRSMLQQCVHGFGALALGSLLTDRAWAAVGDGPLRARRPHHPARARSVIFLYMDGGPSQVDTFDPKPRLEKPTHGKPFAMQDRADAVQQRRQRRFAQPLEVSRPGGECGTAGERSLSARAPSHADDLAVIRSMTSNFSEHTNGNYFLHTGIGVQGRPEHGGLDQLRPGHAECQRPARLRGAQRRADPARRSRQLQQRLSAGDLSRASIFKARATRPWRTSCRSEGSTEALQREQARALLREARPSRGARAHGPGRHDALESAIANYELAFAHAAGRAGADRPLRRELRRHTACTALDAQDKGPTRDLRPAVPAGAAAGGKAACGSSRLTCPAVRRHDRWDQHGELPGARGTRDNALAVDQPIAGLLTRSQSNGACSIATLVVWMRRVRPHALRPGVEDGRDHNPFGFSPLAGGRRREGGHGLRGD